MTEQITDVYHENCLRFCTGQIGLAAERNDVLTFIAVAASHLGAIIGSMDDMSNEDIDKICYNLENIFVESVSVARLNKMKKII